jgi:hypothetical protein
VADRPLDLALVHSRRGGELLADIMSRPELGDLFAGTIISQHFRQGSRATCGSSR